MDALSGKSTPSTSSSSGNSGAATGGATNTGGTTTAATKPTVNPEESAKRDEVKRKNEEIAVKNKRIEESNAIVIRTFKAGNEALKAKRYDEAITQYKEGLVADPEQASLLTNMSVALRERGVERYRAAKDEAARTAAKKDFTDALEAATKALEIVKAEPAATDASGKAQQDLRKRLALFARAEAMRRQVSLVDKSQADAGTAAYDELLAVVTDPAQKLEVQLSHARMLFDAGESEKAAAAYEKILATNPENVDAILYAGLALYGTGDKNKYQAAANYLQRFVDKAPDTHPIKSDAKAVLENLKNQENVQPQRTGGRRRG
jgi:tetratricopeptide (TPR) repeat protein